MKLVKFASKFNKNPILKLVAYKKDIFKFEKQFFFKKYDFTVWNNELSLKVLIFFCPQKNTNFCSSPNF